MRTTVIIGNGFDLNLGLETSYKDFLKSEQFKKIQKRVNIKFFEHFDNLLAENWVDIELELFKFSTKNPVNLKENYFELVNALIDYLSSPKHSEFITSKYAYKFLKNLISDSISNRSELNIINFNYTETVNEILNEFQSVNNFRYINHQQIHGSAREKKIIFGIGDGIIMAVKPEHLFLKKSYPSHYKPTNVSELLKNSDEVHFIGHSIGKTDHYYFQNYFQKAVETQLNSNSHTFYLHYIESGYHDLQAQITDLTNDSLGGFKANTNFHPILIE